MAVTVRVGGKEVTGIWYPHTDGTLQCDVPPGTAGTFDVTVETAGGQATLPKAYRYVRPARIVKVRPTQGHSGQRIVVEYEGIDPNEVFGVAVGNKHLTGLDKTRPGQLHGDIASDAAPGPCDVDIIYLDPARPSTKLPKGFTVLPRRGILRVTPNQGKPARLDDIIIHTIGFKWISDGGPDAVRLVEICGARTSTIGYEKDKILTVFWADLGSARPGKGDVILYADKKGTVEVARLKDGFTNTSKAPAIIDVRPRSGKPGATMIVTTAYLPQGDYTVWLGHKHQCTGQTRNGDTFTCKAPTTIPKGTYDVRLYLPGPTQPTAELRNGFTIT